MLMETSADSLCRSETYSHVHMRKCQHGDVQIEVQLGGQEVARPTEINSRNFSKFNRQSDLPL